jgi:hypothetical protein
MRISTARWRNFDVEFQGAVFTFAPVGFEASMAIDAVMAEIGRIGATRMLELGPQSRHDMAELIRSHLVDWRGVTDERGEVAFSLTAFDRYFDPGVVAWALFWELYKARKPTEDERKNSSTAPSSESSAPRISIADPAAPPASIHAERPAFSDTGTTPANGMSSQ